MAEEHEISNNKISNVDDKQQVGSTTYIPTPVLVENWPVNSHNFGQITAVSIDPQGNPVIFHRADRYWDAKFVNSYQAPNLTCSSILIFYIYFQLI